MNPLLVGSLVVAAVFGLFFLLRSRVARTWTIEPAELPKLVDKLKAAGGRLAWASVLVPEVLADNGDALALDYAAKDGTLCFNWCLLSRKNLEDREKFEAFLAANGFTCREVLARNGTLLLEVPGPGLETLGNRILAELYQATGPCTLLGDGFTWP